MWGQAGVGGDGGGGLDCASGHALSAPQLDGPGEPPQAEGASFAAPTSSCYRSAQDASSLPTLSPPFPPPALPWPLPLPLTRCSRACGSRLRWQSRCLWGTSPPGVPRSERWGWDGCMPVGECPLPHFGHTHLWACALLGARLQLCALLVFGPLLRSWRGECTEPSVLTLTLVLLAAHDAHRCSSAQSSATPTSTTCTRCAALS